MSLQSCSRKDDSIRLQELKACVDTQSIEKVNEVAAELIGVIPTLTQLKSEFHVSIGWPRTIRWEDQVQVDDLLAESFYILDQYCQRESVILKVGECIGLQNDYVSEQLRFVRGQIMAYDERVSQLELIRVISEKNNEFNAVADTQLELNRFPTKESLMTFQASLESLRSRSHDVKEDFPNEIGLLNDLLAKVQFKLSQFHNRESLVIMAQAENCIRKYSLMNVNHLDLILQETSRWFLGFDQFVGNDLGHLERVRVAMLAIQVQANKAKSLVSALYLLINRSAEEFIQSVDPDGNLNTDNAVRLSSDWRQALLLAPHHLRRWLRLTQEGRACVSEAAVNYLSKFIVKKFSLLGLSCCGHLFIVRAGVDFGAVIGKWMKRAEFYGRLKDIDEALAKLN